MNETTSPPGRAAFGPQGEACATCGGLLARDQRYCLQCGARRSGLGAMLAEPREAQRTATVAERGVERPEPAFADGQWRLDAGLLAGVGCLLLALFVGVLIGRGGGDGATRASAPQVVTLGATATPAAGATASFTSDWPAGKRGFTVRLQTLPKDGTGAAAVAAAKQAASAKGAPDVGALDSDQYGSMDPGQYVVFSGQYADRKAAAAALKALGDGFPDAQVVEVAEKATQAAAKAKAGKSAGKAATGAAKKASAADQAAGAQAIKDIESSSGKDYSKKSAKLPKTLVTPGELPPEDTSKPAGGGSDSVTFP